MELLLTPVVSRLLRRFIKSADGQASSNLRVSLSRGSVVLQNLELDLDELLHKLPVRVERAFARQLRIVIPWTSLATQPIQVQLETVELLLAEQAAHADDEAPQPVAPKSEGAPAAAGTSWMGSLTSMLMHTLFNVTVTINNLIVKLAAGGTMATLTCKSIMACTPNDGWQEELEAPEEWLKKVVEVSSLSVTLTERWLVQASAHAGQQPLLQLPLVQIAALAPVMALLSNVAAVSHAEAFIDVLVMPVRAAVAAQQVQWLRSFAAAVPGILRSGAGVSGSGQAPAGVVEPTRPDPEPGPLPESGQHEVAPVPPGARSIGGLLSKAWGFITDEAAALEAQADGVVDPALAKDPQPSWGLRLVLQGGSVECLPPWEQVGFRQCKGSMEATLAPLPQDTAAPEAQEHLHSLPCVKALQTQPQSIQTAAGSQSGSAVATAGPYSGTVEALSQMDTPRTPQLGSGPADRYSPVPPPRQQKRLPCVVLEWCGFVAEASIMAEALQSVQLELQSLHLLRPVACAGPNDNAGLPAAAGSELGRGPSGLSRASSQASADSAALQHRSSEPGYSEFAGPALTVISLLPSAQSDSPGLKNADEEPLVLQLQWHTTSGETAAASTAAAGLQQPSKASCAQHVVVSLAHITCAYVPGFATDVLGMWAAPEAAALATEPGAASQAAAAIGQDGPAAPQVHQQGSRSPAQWLERASTDTLTLSAASFELAALTAHDASAGVVLVQGQRTSCFLGPVKPASRPDSLTASLLSIPQGGAARYGLRAAVELQIATAESWGRAAPDQHGTGNEAGRHAAWQVQAASSTLQVQMLLQLTGQASSFPETPDETLLCAAISPVDFHFSGQQVATMLAAAGAAQAEASRKFCCPLPDRALAPEQQWDLGKTPWLSHIGVNMQQCLVAAQLGGRLAATTDPQLWGLPPKALDSASWALSSNSCAVHVGTGRGSNFAQPAVALKLQRPLACGIPWQVLLPALDVGVGHLHSAPDTPDAAAEESQSTSSRVWQQQGPDCVFVTLAKLSASRDVMVAVTLADVSLQLDCAQLHTLEHFAYCASVGPMLPVTPGYPPMAAPQRKQLSITLSARTVVGAVRLEDCGAECNFALQQALVNYTSHTVWAVQGQRLPSGFYCAPVYRKRVQLWLRLLDVGMQQHPCPPTHLLRCKSAGQREGLQLTYSKTDRLEAGASSDVVLSMEPLQLRLQADIVQALRGLVQAAIANLQAACRAEAPQPPGAPSTTSIKLAVAGLQLIMAASPQAGACGAGMHPTPASELPHIRLQTEDVVFILHDGLATDARQLLSTREPKLRRGDMSVVAARVEVHSPGVKLASQQVLQPADLQLTFSASQAPEAFSAAVRVSSLLLLLSPASAACLASLAQSMLKSSSASSAGSESQSPQQGADTLQSSSPVCSQALEPQKGQTGPLPDDLRCGMFSLASTATSRPGPMQVSLGNKEPGLIPWAGSTESWICWRYPWPRPVLQLLVEGGASMLAGAKPELSFFHPDAEQFVRVAIRQEVLGGSSPGDLLYFVEGEPVAAEEWQLCWDASSQQAWEQHVLTALRVNPGPSALPLLRPLQATATLQCPGLHVRLLLELSPEGDKLPVEEVASVTCRHMLVGIHRWPHAASLAAYGLLAVHVHQATTLSMEPLLDGIKFAIGLEHSSTLSQTGSSSTHGMDLEQVKELLLDVTEMQLLLPRPEPEQDGLAICARLGSTAVVLMSETMMRAILRAVALTKASVRELSAHHGTQPGDSASAAAVITEEGGPTTAASKNAAAAHQAIRIQNSCPLEVLLAQAGTGRHAQLAAGCSCSFTWAATAQQLLSIAAAEAELLMPSAAAVGAASSSQWLQDEKGAGQQRQPLWCQPVDIMTSGSCRRHLQWADGAIAELAVVCKAEQHQWHVQLLPPVVLANKAPGVQVCFVGWQAQHYGLATAAAEPPREMLDLSQAQGSVQLMPLRLPRKQEPRLHVWLSAGSGWSSAVSLGSTPQVQLVSAGGLGAGVPTSPTSASHQDVAPGLYSQLSSPDRLTAQTCVTLWPLCFVHNGLPFPVDWRLADSGSDALQPSSTLRRRSASFCTQAGESRLLPLVSEGSQLLSFGADTKPRLPPSGSGFCQVLTRPAGPSTAAVAGHQRQQGQLLMPGSGQSLTVSIQEPGGAPFSCMLAARSLADDLPVLQLSLLPHTVVHNCTEMALVLEAPGADPSHIVPGRSTALDWRPLQIRPGKGLLMLEAAAAAGVLPVCLRSKVFALEPGQQQVLLHTQPTLAAAPGASATVKGRADQARRQAGNPPALCHLAVSISMERHGAGSQGTQPAGGRASHPSGLPEVMHITVCAGCHVSNLSPWDLLLTPLHATAAVRVEPGTPRHPRQIRVRSGASSPLLFVWQAASLQAAQQIKQQIVVGLGLTLKPGQQSPGPASPQRPHSSPSTGSVLHSQTRTSDCMLCLTQPCGRQRLYLQGQNGVPMLLSYRILQTAGRLHLVLFEDHQPPCRVANATPAAIEVGLFLPARDKLGELQLGKPLHIVVVQADTDAELAADQPAAEGDNTEGEEAFLEQATGQAAAPPRSQQLLVRFRSSATAEWSAPLALRPGTFAAGLYKVQMEWACATLKVLVKPASHQPQLPSSEEPLPAAAASSRVPITVTLSIEALQLSLWDDGRHRLMGPAPAQPPRGWRGQRQPDQHQHQPSPSVEMFCLHLSQLGMHMFRAWRPGAEGRSACVAMGALVQAEGLQLDSYVPGSSHPVLTQSVAASPVGHSLQGRSVEGTVAPFCVNLEVCRVASAWPPPPMSFRNTWVQHLRVQLPTVTAAIDDAHLAFLERLQQLLSAASGGRTPAPGTSLTQQGDPQGAAGGSGPAGGWSQAVPNPSRLLEHARNNPELSQALDRLGSDTRLAASPAPSSSPSRQGQAALSPGGAPLTSTGSSASPGTQRQGRLEDTSAPAPAAGRGQMPAAGQLEAGQLLAEALGASASRLLIRHTHISRVQLLVDLHITRGAMALDTHRSPLRLPAVQADSLLFRPSIMLHGLLAHYVAEALLNAPQMIGSLELLLNPTGLLQSVGQGFADLIAMPLAAIEARSPSQFIWGMGAGSASLVRHVSGWTLASISGFTGAFSRVLIRAVVARGQERGLPPQRVEHLASGVAAGLQGLYGGFAAGLVGIVRTPMQSYSSGHSVLSGIGQGLLGAVGLPLSGALDLLGAVSTGLAASAGVGQQPSPVRDARQSGGTSYLSLSGLCQTLSLDPLSSTALARNPLSSPPSGVSHFPAHSSAPVLAYCPAEHAALHLQPGGRPAEAQDHAPVLAAAAPVLALLRGSLIVFQNGGLDVVAVLDLHGARLLPALGPQWLSLVSVSAISIHIAQAHPVELHARLEEVDLTILRSMITLQMSIRNGS